MDDNVAASIKHIEMITALAAGLSAESQSSDEIRSRLAEYLTIRVSGLIEVSVKAILLDGSKHAAVDTRVLSFVEYQLTRQLDLKESKIRDLVGHFSSEWGNAVEHRIVGQMKDSVDSVVATRNLLAHGGNAVVTLGTASEWYLNVLDAMHVLATICDPEAESWFSRPSSETSAR